MNDSRIQADSFILKSRGIRIYRIRQKGRATVLYGCCEEASRYLQKIKGQELPVEQKGR